MFLSFLRNFSFLLEQTPQEKRITYLGVSLLAFFVFVLMMDSFSKGKLIPSKGPIKKIIITFFIILVAVIILLSFLYK